MDNVASGRYKVSLAVYKIFNIEIQFKKIILGY